MNFPRLKDTLLLMLLTISASTSTSAEQEKEQKDTSHLFKALDIFELEYAADPRISPNGRQVVYVRNSMDIMTDSSRANLWIINFDGTGHRPLLSGRLSFSSPRWSPGGKRLAYISGAEGSPQLYVRGWIPGKQHC